MNKNIKNTLIINITDIHKSNMAGYKYDEKLYITHKFIVPF